MLTQRPDRASPFTRRDASRFVVTAGILIVALTAIFLVDIIPSGLALQVGDVSKAQIAAPRALQYVSPILTAQDKQAAESAVLPTYDYTVDKAGLIANQQAEAFATTVTPVDSAFDPLIGEAVRTQLLNTVYLPELSDAGRKTLVSLSATQWKAVRDEAAQVLDQIERAELRDSDVATTRSGLASRMLGNLTAAERSLAAELVGPLLVPNSTFSAGLFADARAAAAQAVPDHVVSVKQDETIVDKGHAVTALDMEKVNAFHLNEPTLDVARLAGFVLLSVLLVVLLIAWVWRYRPGLWHRNNVLLLLGLIVVFCTFALKLTAGRNILPFFLPIAAVGMLVSILLDASAATILLAILAVIAGAVNGSSLEMAAYVFLGGFAGILAVRRGDRLNLFVQAGLSIALVNVTVISIFSLLGARDLTAVVQLFGAAIGAAGGSAVAAVGSFAVLGNLFGILTVFQMLELANPSQPLLRRLLTETPGTYHHSLMVGNLAERAAEAIGADPLLTRVAAYYHDIGKLANPAAFIENQAGGDNLHDDLEPEVSAQILKQHVADGIDLAYRQKLPKTLISFIPQHHGTAIMSYFYSRAKEIAAEAYGGTATEQGAAAAAAVDERRFRHAGPKPQSREAAIIMLADGVEASVRSLSARDEGAIRGMVSRIISERMSDGQFNECDLTLRDVERIREAFVQQLLGMYHQRIAYPQNKIVELESRRIAGGGPGA
ncbi:MAG TPA: HDIG domain-containing protein [Candidatus Acidoferrum sp.]|nr:HDIG domain-containing protein [Candidatus Acidoferrum sp.]